MNLAERLRSERLELGLSQAQLATLGGVQANTQCHYETGSRSPRADYLMSVASLGIDVQYVLLGIRSVPLNTELSPVESSVIRSLRRVNATDRRAFEQVLMSMAVKSKSLKSRLV